MAQPDLTVAAFANAAACDAGRRRCCSLGAGTLLGALLAAHGASQAEAPAAKAIAVSEWRVPTAHVNLRVAEYRLPMPLRGIGGALALFGDVLILATAEGRFIRIDPQDMNCRVDFLPTLEMGSAQIEQSQRFKWREHLPRVHDLVFHSERFYVTHDYYNAEEDAIYFMISGKPRRGGRWTTVYRSPALDAPYFPLGTGGKMAVMAREGRLYFTVGDYSLDRINHLPTDIAPQNPALPWGKVHYLDLNDYTTHMFSLGHRNQQGLVILSDGRLLATEHGPQGGDEINVIKAGRNYGWPYRSYGTQYGSFEEYNQTLPASPVRDFEEPLFCFVPAIAPTQLIQVAAFDRHWDGDLLMASLRARSLFHIRLASDRVVYCEPIPVGHRLRDVKQWNDRFILLTDESELLVVSADRD